MPVLIVRHASAVSRDAWNEEDGARPLSAKGRRQALLLGAALLELKPGRVMSSPAIRCIDTVRPLAEAVGVPVEAESALAEGSYARALDLVRSLAGQDVALCSHGDVIPAVLEGLAAEDGVDLGRNPKVEKGSAWVLDAKGDRFVRARYLRPPEGA